MKFNTFSIHSHWSYSVLRTVSSKIRKKFEIASLSILFFYLKCIIILSDKLLLIYLIKTISVDFEKKMEQGFFLKCTTVKPSYQKFICTAPITLPKICWYVKCALFNLYKHKIRDKRNNLIPFCAKINCVNKQLLVYFPTAWMCHVY